jgi:hypothetical protein
MLELGPSTLLECRVGIPCWSAELVYPVGANRDAELV